jgi:Putative bacterial sensory transduction regulator
MTTPNILSLTPDTMREILQEVGYRVESFTDPSGAIQLRSATNGLPFVRRFGNRVAGTDIAHADASFTLVLQMQGGALPPDLFNQWNRSKRFGRLYSGENFLVLEMDFTVMGGVSRDNLRVQVSVWDSVVQELIRFLRTALAPTSEAGAINGRAEGAPASPVLPVERTSETAPAAG